MTYQRDLARWERRKRVIGWAIVAVGWTALCWVMWEWGTRWW